MNDLLSDSTGYIGSRRTVIEQVQQAIIQLATFHSYHDAICSSVSWRRTPIVGMEPLVTTYETPAV